MQGGSTLVSNEPFEKAIEEAAAVRSPRDGDRPDCFTNAHFGNYRHRSIDLRKTHWAPGSFGLCLLHYRLHRDALPALPPQSETRPKQTFRDFSDRAVTK